MSIAFRTVSAAAILVAAAAGCAPGVRRDDAPARLEQSSPVAAVTEDRKPEPAPVGEQAGAVELDDFGAPFKTTWTRPAAAASGAASAPRRPQFFVSMLGESANAYRLHLQMKPNLSDDSRVGRSEKPTIAMSVDGCQLKVPPALTGDIQFGGAASPLTIARNRLPKGDLRVIIRAHGQETNMDFRHDADGLRPMTPDEVAGYIETPADPATGEPGVSSHPRREDCP